MAVGLTPASDLAVIDGIRLAVSQAGIKKPNKNDVTLIELNPEARCACVFTQNRFCAAPVIVAKHHLSQKTPRYLLINTGNANAGTGDEGVANAEKTCQSLAQLLHCDPCEILPFSTGVIGEPLPVDKIIASLPNAIEGLSENNWQSAAGAIMTTDTIPKGFSARFTIEGEEIVITGISKGAGMIKPNMATMLAYVATNAAINPAILQAMLQVVVDKSFNSITIDSDTSTNDACVLIASGKSSLEINDLHSASAQLFLEKLQEVCNFLAQAIVRDGEGATKFITINVDDGQTIEECRRVAYTIAHSPLVKTAFFASDPNWGRILAAIGRAEINDLEVRKVNIYLDDVCIVQAGGRAPSYTEDQGQRVMNQDDITIRVELMRGNCSATVWTSDLSYDYVKINAEYRT